MLQILRNTLCLQPNLFGIRATEFNSDVFSFKFSFQCMSCEEQELNDDRVVDDRFDSKHTEVKKKCKNHTYTHTHTPNWKSVNNAGKQNKQGSGRKERRLLSGQIKKQKAKLTSTYDPEGVQTTSRGRWSLRVSKHHTLCFPPEAQRVAFKCLRLLF